MPKPLTNLDIDLVRTFATIARLGSFTQAAERLGRQQSTISLQIARLEAAVNTRLLERSPRSVSLTTEGKVFLDYAHRMLDLNDEAVARFGEPMMTGFVRLGTPEDFATRHLPDVLARFSQAYPSIALEVTCDLPIWRFRPGAGEAGAVGESQGHPRLARAARMGFGKPGFPGPRWVGAPGRVPAAMRLSKARDHGAGQG